MTTSFSIRYLFDIDASCVFWNVLPCPKPKQPLEKYSEHVICFWVLEFLRWIHMYRPSSTPPEVRVERCSPTMTIFSFCLNGIFFISICIHCFLSFTTGVSHISKAFYNFNSKYVYSQLYKNFLWVNTVSD